MKRLGIGLLLLSLLIMLIGCPDPVDEPSTYSVTYDGNGSSAGTAPVDTNRYESGATVTVLDYGTLMRDGYTLRFWNTNADGSGMTYAPGDVFTMSAMDITLHAIWMITPTYEVEYVSSGHTTGDPPEDPNEYEEGEEVTVLDQGTLLRTDYTFEGWNTQDDLGGTTYAPGGTFDMGSLNVSLFAEWEPVPAYSHTVTIDGTNDFSATDETFATTTSLPDAYTAYFSWDDTYFYFGLDGTDVGSGDDADHLLLYLGATGNTIPVGRQYGAQQPDLPFGATCHAEWGANGTTLNAYENDGVGWTAASWSPDAGDIARSGTFVEGRIAITNLGLVLPATLSVHMSMINTADGEWTWAGVPSTSFSDGSDPDYGAYYQFYLSGPTPPTGHVPQ
jgi:uncharacterized repeat protein (TIGR02543 family)